MEIFVSLIEETDVSVSFELLYIWQFVEFVPVNADMDIYSILANIGICYTVKR